MTPIDPDFDPSQWDALGNPLAEHRRFIKAGERNQAKIDEAKRLEHEEFVRVAADLLTSEALDAYCQRFTTTAEPGTRAEFEVVQLVSTVNWLAQQLVPKEAAS